MKQNGFTLIEILVTSTILIVLMAIAVGSFRTASETARNAKRKADMETVRQAMVLRKSETGDYLPGTYSDVTSNGTFRTTYLAGVAPADPKGTVAYFGTATATAFCFCAQLEPATSTKGNASGATSTTCNWVAAGSNHYCVSNP